MKLLILGGTADARHLAAALYQPLQQLAVSMLYSVAGLVRRPNLDCEVISGGFRQFGGLAQYINEQQINAILDATHPYAQHMGEQAVSAAAQCGIPCWRLLRPQWQAEEKDIWQHFSSWQTLLPALEDKRSIFLSAGQLNPSLVEQLAALAARQGQRYLLRTAVQPKHALLNSMAWIKALGPFDYQDELVLLKRYQIDCIVSKNSGGDATKAKITAARQLQIPVLMLERPSSAESDQQFADPAICQGFITTWFQQQIVSAAQQ